MFETGRVECLKRLHDFNFVLPVGYLCVVVVKFIVVKIPKTLFGDRTLNILLIKLSLQ